MLEWLKFGWDIVKTGKGWLDKRQKIEDKPLLTSPSAVAERFVELFEEHGVRRSQIASFFGRSLALKDFKDNDSLIEVLSDQHLEAAAELFAVRPEWLYGVDEQIYPIHHFYKQPDDFQSFLNTLLETGNKLDGALLVPDRGSRNCESVIVLEERVGQIGDLPICRYHLCGGWVFSYWKCRGHITACVAAAWDKNVCISGQKLPEPLLDSIAQGCRLIGVSEWHGGLPRLGYRWDAQDLADSPDVYINGVDSERDKFGIRSAFQLWLDLEQNGYMRSGYGEPPRESFELALKSID